MFVECNNSAFFSEIFDRVTRERSSSSSAISFDVKSVLPLLPHADAEPAGENIIAKSVEVYDIDGDDGQTNVSSDHPSVEAEKRKMSLTDLVDEEINACKVGADDASVSKKAD